MDDLSELIARVRAATGPDRDLDAAILYCLGFHAWAGRMSYRDGPMWVDFGSSTITGSTDAARTLQERVLPGMYWRMAKGRVRPDEPLYAFQLLRGSDEVIAEAEHEDMNCAIILATLLALQAKEQSK